MASSNSFYPPRQTIAPPDEDDVGSGLMRIAQCSVLLYVQKNAECSSIDAALSDRELFRMPVYSHAELLRLSYLPRFAVVDSAAPSAREAIEWLSAKERGTAVIALLAPGEAEGPVLRAGAQATLHHPCTVDDIMFVLDRLREAEVRRAETKELFGQSSAAVGSRNSAERACAALVHEIRNPLTAARGNVELMRDASCRDAPSLSVEDRDEMLAEIADALCRIESVAAAMGTLARGDAPPLAPVDLLEIARETVAAVRAPKRVRVRVAGEPGIVAMANRGLLVQVTVNLLRNAIEALEDTRHPEVVVRVYRTAGEARISVRDNGPGIPVNKRDRIFEPFYSTKGAAGTGLGLAISSHAVRSMGGALTLSGENPPGACFRVRLRPVRSVEAGRHFTLLRETSASAGQRSTEIAQAVPLAAGKPAGDLGRTWTNERIARR
jgi:signal transduction histidine kinase